MVKFSIKKHYLVEKEFSFEMESINVVSMSRPLTMHWTPEMVQDVSAFHNIDAEAELTAMLTEQIASEIDREIIRNLRDTQINEEMSVQMIPRRFTLDGSTTMEPRRQLRPHNFIKRVTTFFDGLLPLVRQVSASTIGLDLVPVVPMSAPSGNLFYLDYGNPIEPTVHDDGSWNHGKTFGSHLFDFELKPHIFIKKGFEVIDTVPNNYHRTTRRRPTRLNRR